MYKLEILIIFSIVATSIPGIFAGHIRNGKISAPLLESLESKMEVNIMVSMKQSSKSVLNKVAAMTFANRGDRATAVYNALTAHSSNSQKNVLAFLNSIPNEITTFWITNKISIKKATKSLIETLAAMEDVSEIYEEEILHLYDPIQTKATKTSKLNRSEILAEWGIDKIRAPAAWSSYGTGAGVVIGVIDSGARFTHEALEHSYRGGNYSWFNPNSNTSRYPIDDNGHGTHTTGTIAGSHGIGVAPGAQWISCKAFGRGGAPEGVLLKCMEFMVCPTHWDGSNPDCTKAPHIVSNSWGSTSGRTTFDDVLSAWHAADIIPVFAVGNSGSCKTISGPADSRVGVIGVGATNDVDSVTNFSSRGPTEWGQQKPDIAAPGNAVRSAGHLADYSYAVNSGTSMATPHVAGVIGLMKSKNPNANYTTIKKALEDSAERALVFNAESCEGKPENEFPNYHSGYGRVDALRAVQTI